MIKHKSYVEIEDHVSKLHIRGWETAKTMRGQDYVVIYKGIADGKRFAVETNGRMPLKDVINQIVKAVKK